jgi:hypothetical protein
MSSSTSSGGADVCQHCGIDLPLDEPAYQKFCCRECRVAASEATFQLTRDSYNTYRREERLRAKANRPPCAECGGPIAPTASARAKYCCIACGTRAYNRRRSALLRQARLAERAR